MTVGTRERDRDPLQEHLLPMLLEALAEQRDRRAPVRRRGRRRGIAVLVAATLAATTWMIAGSIADATIEVHANDALRDPGGVEKELAERGIDARVVSVPTDASLQGKWFHLYLAPGSDVDRSTFAVLQSQVGHIDMGIPAVAERCGDTGGDCQRTSVLELPLDLPGKVTLVVGRAPRPTERYWNHVDWINELAPSGALYCYELEARPIEETAGVLDRLGYKVIWTLNTPEVSRDVDEPPAGFEVTDAWFSDPNVLRVGVAPPERADAMRRSVGTPSEDHPRSSITWAPDC